MIEIIDINGKERHVKNNLKIITDTRSNEVGKVFHENIDGELVSQKEMTIVDVEEQFVEATIIGKNREWVEWYPLKLFEEMNPEIKI